MINGKVGIGIIGTGFGRAVQIPAFKHCSDAEIVAVCSSRLEKAQATAQEFVIPYAFANYHQMLELSEIDLVSVVTPPYLHYPMVMAALDAGKHVLCEKPMAMNFKEAAEMYQKAEFKNVLHIIDHELRFSVTRAKAKELIDNGYIGRLRHVNVIVSASFNADPRGRPWGWWFQEAKGGGILGANGSHYIDLLRWWFGEIHTVCGQLSTCVPMRKLPDSEDMRPVETDDVCAFLVEFTSGAKGAILLSTVAYHPQGHKVEVFGDEGTIIVDAQDRLWGARKGESQLIEITVSDPVAQLEGIPNTIWARSFVHLAEHLVEAIKSGSRALHAATFYDGMRCQQVMDAVRLSWQERRWVEIQEVHA